MTLLPGLRALNQGSLEAYRVLTQAQAGGLVDTGELAHAALLLERAVQWQPDNSQTHRMLGRLYGWLGQYKQAMEALDQGVRLDGEDGVSRYGPWFLWLLRLQSEDPGSPWHDLIWPYSHWMRRFPQRAESYVQIALIWEKHMADPVRARELLESALENEAEPRGLLVYYLSQLE